MLSAEADDIPGKANPLIVVLFVQDINYYSYIETCLPRSMFSWTGLHLSVANSGFEGMFKTPIIVQIAVVICWVVVLLFLLYFNAEWKVDYFFYVKREIIRHFLQPHLNNWADAISSPELIGCRPFLLAICCTIDVILPDIRKRLQNPVNTIWLRRISRGIRTDQKRRIILNE